MPTMKFDPKRERFYVVTPEGKRRYLDNVTKEKVFDRRFVNKT